MRPSLMRAAPALVALLLLGTARAAGAPPLSRTAATASGRAPVTVTTLPVLVDVCNVSFELVDAVTAGSLQFDVDYTGVPGEFLGSGPDVANGGTLECHSEIPGALAAFSDDDAGLLTAGIIKPAGFTGPIMLATCVLVPDAGADVAPEDFAVTVVDAKDPQVQPIDPTPVVSVARIDCTRCGNGVVNAGEDCDDGNTAGGDGCSAVCTLEDGWECSRDLPVCLEICGDGVLVGAEQCDDGNVTNGDGCSARCTVEAGWDCDDGEVSSCTQRCGDGVVVGTEDCDDGDTTWALGESCGADCKRLACCDPDGSGRVTASDALLVLLNAVVPARNTCPACVCDAIRTGAALPVTSVDSLACLRTAVGIPTAIACPACNPRILINEVSFMPASGSEWVELVNRSDAAVDLRGFELSDEDGSTYAIPATLPRVPTGYFVVVVFDGRGPAADDVDFGDHVATLHTGTAALAGDVFDDDADSVYLFSSSDHSGATLVDSLTWGDVAHYDRLFSMSSTPDSRFPMETGQTLGLEPYFTSDVRHWEVYESDEVTQGAANPVNRPKWFRPAAGTTTTGRRPVLAWQHSGVDIVRYELQCDDAASFSSPLFSEDLFVQQFTPASDLPLGTLDCRVRAVDSAGQPSAYTTVAFQVGPPAPSFVGGARQAGHDADLHIGVLEQKKDSRMVCLFDNGAQYPVLGSTGPHAWDAPHATRACDHDDTYCCRTAIAMVASYYGGSLTQDRISYECYAGSTLNGENDDLRHGVGMWPTCASTSSPGRNLIEWALNLPAGSFTGVQNPSAVKICPDTVSGSKPSFATVKGYLDAGRPIIWVTHKPFHCHVIDGYTDPNGTAGDGDDLIHVLDPWTGIEDQRSFATFNYGPNAAYFVLPATASARSDEPSVSSDADFDGLPRFTGVYESRKYNKWGLMAFDEQNRFSTSPTAFDSDGDCIDDKVEVWSYTFPGARSANTDGDSLRAELDSDSDNGGLCDGDDRQEDRNKDGDVDSGETNPFVDDETLTGCQCTPLGGGSPDLIAEPGSAGVGYCRLDQQGKLVVRVRNQGGGAAGASMTRVTFSPGGAVTLATPSIAAHDFADVVFTAPSACYDPDCNFTINVDSAGQVSESDETNNQVAGLCVG